MGKEFTCVRNNARAIRGKTRHAVNKKIHSKLAKSDQSIAKILERLNTAFVNGKFFNL
ncbi:MAG: hypothetical protein ACLRQF_04335 [Thomasclavelia ramosa]